ncbi:hypothetical protein ElyMa_000957500 [Elysia marginata]|uniref:C2H2-type domain-containing protein n=1 Tax=Elysia marginata TaxID=1093978 RepID=A0AAV4HDV3_9GAST|nr:hypothetical protein ElyMa_000957500 [Elysia marginata]
MFEFALPPRETKLVPSGHSCSSSPCHQEKQSLYHVATHIQVRPTTKRNKACTMSTLMFKFALPPRELPPRETELAPCQHSCSSSLCQQEKHILYHVDTHVEVRFATKRNIACTM